MSVTQCAVHPDVEATMPCRQCGRFCCRACLPMLETCVECVKRADERIAPLPTRRLLWCQTTAAILGCACSISFMGLAPPVPPLAIAAALAKVVSAVIVFLWFRTAAERALLRGATFDGDTARQAATTLFLPYAALIAIAHLVALFESSGRRAPWFVWVWPSLFLASLLLAVVALVRWSLFDATGFATMGILVTVEAVVGGLVVSALRFDPWEPRRG